MRRRRRCCTWTLALLLALLFAGCGRVETVPEDREVPPLETEQEETEEPVPETPAAPNALTAEEIIRVNEAFAPFLNGVTDCTPTRSAASLPLIMSGRRAWTWWNFCAISAWGTAR